LIIEQKKIAILAKNGRERGEFICFKSFCQPLFAQINAGSKCDEDAGLQGFQLKMRLKQSFVHAKFFHLHKKFSFIAQISSA